MAREFPLTLNQRTGLSWFHREAAGRFHLRFTCSVRARGIIIYSLNSDVLRQTSNKNSTQINPRITPTQGHPVHDLHLTAPLKRGAAKRSGLPDSRPRPVRPNIPSPGVLQGSAGAALNEGWSRGNHGVSVLQGISTLLSLSPALLAKSRLSSYV